MYKRQLGGDAADFSSFSITRTTDPLLRDEYWTVIPLDAASFPSDVESLRFFDVLAVDGFDMGTLTQRQQDALDGWLKGGGVAVVGGGGKAAENFGFFERYTGAVSYTHLLGAPKGKDAELFAQAAERAADAAECYISEGPERAMNKYNRKAQ